MEVEVAPLMMLPLKIALELLLLLVNGPSAVDNECQNRLCGRSHWYG